MFCQLLRLGVWLPAVALVVASVGCHSGQQTIDNRYRELSHDFLSSQNQPVSTSAALNPVVHTLSGPHSLEEYIHVGLQQNSEIQEVRLMVESMANRVPQVASLPDPMLNATAFPSPVQTAAGEQEFALSMNQKFPWRGKLATKAGMAEEEVNSARAQLAAVELKVVEQIKNAYYQLYFVQHAISIVGKDKQELERIEDIVDQMYRVKREVTQQDVLQIQVALARIDAELVQLKQQGESTQARLARLLHVSPETKPEAMDSLPPDQTVQNIEQLYELAVQSRPELHAQLATIKRDRKAKCLAELQSYPDVTFGFNWISNSSEGISPVANGDDAFMLTLAMNLPLYRKRLDAGVREAQTRALSNARKYDRLKDETMEVVADLFAKIKSQQETLRLFRDDIIPRQQMAFTQSRDDYQVGKVDFLQMIDNWRQLLRYQIQEKRLETELQQTLAALARQIGDWDVPESATAGQPSVETNYQVSNENDEPTIEDVN